MLVWRHIPGLHKPVGRRAGNGVEMEKEDDEGVVHAGTGSSKNMKVSLAPGRATFASLVVGERRKVGTEEGRNGPGSDDEDAALALGDDVKVWPSTAQFLKHPLALFALVPKDATLFAAAAAAGAAAKTLTAPLDRIKLLMQVRCRHFLQARLLTVHVVS